MARGKHEAAKKSEKTKPEKKPKRSGGAKKAVLIIAVVCVLLAAAALGGGYLAGHSDKIHPGMTLGGVSIGDMTVSEATAALEKAGCDFAGGSVEVTLPGDFEFAVSAEQAGMAMSCAQAAQAAFDYGHSGNVFGDLVCYFKSITGSVSDAEILASASTDGVRAAVDKALADYNEHMGKGYEVNEESQTLKMIKGLSTKDIDADKLCQSIIKAFSDEMLRDIEKDTVDWDPNFDETRKEPRVLPSRFPNLLVNGSSGIAVGMATNIPPHNLTEVINACICVLDNPEATMNELLQHVTGPDFPTKGIILGRSGIR